MNGVKVVLSVTTGWEPTACRWKSIDINKVYLALSVTVCRLKESDIPIYIFYIVYIFYATLTW